MRRTSKKNTPTHTLTRSEIKSLTKEEQDFLNQKKEIEAELLKLDKEKRSAKSSIEKSETEIKKLQSLIDSHKQQKITKEKSKRKKEEEIITNKTELAKIAEEAIEIRIEKKTLIYKSIRKFNKLLERNDPYHDSCKDLENKIKKGFKYLESQATDIEPFIKIIERKKKILTQKKLNNEGQSTRFKNNIADLQDRIFSSRIAENNEEKIGRENRIASCRELEKLCQKNIKNNNKKIEYLTKIEEKATQYKGILLNIEEKKKEIVNLEKEIEKHDQNIENTKSIKKLTTQKKESFCKKLETTDSNIAECRETLKSIHLPEDISTKATAEQGLNVYNKDDKTTPPDSPRYVSTSPPRTWNDSVIQVASSQAGFVFAAFMVAAAEDRHSFTSPAAARHSFTPPPKPTQDLRNPDITEIEPVLPNSDVIGTESIPTLASCDIEEAFAAFAAFADASNANTTTQTRIQTRYTPATTTAQPRIKPIDMGSIEIAPIEIRRGFVTDAFKKRPHSPPPAALDISSRESSFEITV